ncbi:hypothetical protein Tsubulata_035074 [Turnera subulata]|uniref:Sulfite exporter TauE/SafE family protein n=1 Tax=Turnera subulata TaxID=218843 RepID=A0A9Q0FPT3_9ROSI|nr:hypothetical protein Tsubulata_035074 [Turnera subulata]
MMYGVGPKECEGRTMSRFIYLVSLIVVASLVTLAESSLQQEFTTNNGTLKQEPRHINNGRSSYQHVWPEIKLDWKIVVGSIIGFIGAACGSVGGVGGGGIFVPMLALVIGFDPKSSTAMSKCMITGAAAATVGYNLRMRHPTLELPLIDYDLALLFQPMLILGISIGVTLNVIFADWMITVLLIVLFIVISSRAFYKGVDTWKKETKLKRKSAGPSKSNDTNPIEDVESKPPPDQGPIKGTPTENKKEGVSIIKNVYWKELGFLISVWLIILVLQIGKNYSTTCSWEYWLLDVLQIPVTLCVSSYEAINLYKGRRKIASLGDKPLKLQPHKLVFYCALGVFAGIIAGMLGLGGGSVLGPLFLEMGVPPQVSSATATFAMMFSGSMSVVEYYLLKRFPVPYALYFFAVATISALVGQHVVRKVIKVLGRASLIIFFLAFTIFVSAISLGGVGLARMIQKIDRKEYMGFESLCS